MVRSTLIDLRAILDWSSLLLPTVGILASFSVCFFLCDSSFANCCGTSFVVSAADIPDDKWNEFRKAQLPMTSVV